MTDDKVVRFPIVPGGKDCDEAQVMILLGRPKLHYFFEG